MSNKTKCAVVDSWFVKGSRLQKKMRCHALLPLRTCGIAARPSSHVSSHTIFSSPFVFSILAVFLFAACTLLHYIIAFVLHLTFVYYVFFFFQSRSAHKHTYWIICSQTGDKYSIHWKQLTLSFLPARSKLLSYLPRSTTSYFLYILSFASLLSFLFVTFSLSLSFRSLPSILLETHLFFFALYLVNRTVGSRTSNTFLYIYLISLFFSV